MRVCLKRKGYRQKRGRRSLSRNALRSCPSESPRARTSQFVRHSPNTPRASSDATGDLKLRNQALKPRFYPPRTLGIKPKEHGKNNFAISSANHPTECDGYFGFAEVIFPVFLSDNIDSIAGQIVIHIQNRSRPRARHCAGCNRRVISSRVCQAVGEVRLRCEADSRLRLLGTVDQRHLAATPVRRARDCQSLHESALARCRSE